jgi:hypothetical protein
VTLHYPFSPVEVVAYYRAWYGTTRVESEYLAVVAQKDTADRAD